MSETPDNAPLPDDSDDAALAQRAVRGGLWVMGSAYWMVLVGFAANIALTRIINDEVAFGIFAGAMFYAELLRLQTKLGLSYAFVNHKALSGEALGTYFALELLAIGGGLLLTFLVLPLLLWLGYGQWVEQGAAVVQVALVLAVAVALEGLGGMCKITLEKELQFSHLSLLNIVVFPLAYLPALWLAWRGAGVWSLVAFVYTLHSAQLVGILWLLRTQARHIWRLRWRFSWRLGGHFLRYGATAGLSVLATMLLTRLDDFYIMVFVGVGVLGFYDRAYRTAQWPSTLLAALTARIAFYTYARLQDDRVRLHKTVSMVLWLIVMLAMPLALAIFIAAPEIIVLLYGPDWLPAAVFLRILVLFAVIRPLWENASNLFVAIGKPRLTLVFMAAQAGVLLVAGLPLTLLYGALGTCGAVGLAFAVGMYLIERDIVREIGLNMGRELATPLLVLLATLAGALLLRQVPAYAGVPLVVQIGLLVGYTFVAFYGLLLLVQRRTLLQRVGLIWQAARRRG